MRSHRFSFTDLIAGICVVLVIASISLARIQQHRVAARRSACADNLFHLVLAAHNYHSAFKQMPMGSGGTSAAPNSQLSQSNQDRLSVWVAMLPFYQQQALWEDISNHRKFGGQWFPAMGPAPWFDSEVYSPWSQRPKQVTCPTDPDAEKFSTAASYVVNYGDAIHMVGSPYDPDDVTIANSVSASNRGLFYGKHVLKFRNNLDGLSNTVMFSEARIGGKPVAKKIDGLSLDPSRCLAAHRNPTTKFWVQGRGACWADGCLRSSGFQTILPPNSLSATSINSDLEGVMSASSYHAGGVNSAFADGAVRFIANSINAGKSNSPSVAFLPDGKHAKPKSKSPYGLWGAIGTRACAEIINRDDDGMESPTIELTDREANAIRRRPIQTWRLADNKSDIQGQMIAVSDDDWLHYWSTGEDKMRQIPLRKLDSIDARRVEEQYDRQLSRVILRLKVQATKAIKMLSKNQYDEFSQEMTQSETHDQKQLATLVQKNHIFLERTLEHLIKGLSDPESRMVSRRMTANAPVTIRLRILDNSPMGDVALYYVDDQWIFRTQ